MRTGPVASRHKRLRLPLALLAAAILAIQLGWLIGSAPFTEMDGVDHAYRAVSVAEGHITDHSASPEARGYLIWVPDVMVNAAHGPCSRLEYMKVGNCSAVSAPNAHGDVLVGSAAATYNPVYYEIVGLPAVTLAPHSGTAMLIIIRIVTMLWCDLLLGAAVLSTTRLSGSVWSTLGVIATALPVPLSASVSAAPNGVQMAGGVLMWAAMCALIFTPSATARQQRWLIGLWTLGSCSVLVTHSTGPMWFGLSFLIGLGLLGKRRIKDLFIEQRLVLTLAAGTVAIVGLLCAAWIILERTNVPTSLAGHHRPGLSDFLGQPFVWILQCIGNLPFRNNFAPPVVYLLGLAIIVCLLVAALRQRYRAGRRALLAIVVLSLGISEGLNFVTFAGQGNAWQGRYTLALTFGIPILCGWIIGTHSSARQPRGGPDRVLAGSFGLALGLINAITLAHVWKTFNQPTWPKHYTWSAPPSWVIVGLGIAATVLMAAATERLAQRVSLNASDDRALL